MTRLITDDIRHIPESLDAYDEELLRKTGLDLKGLACDTWGVNEAEFENKAAAVKAAVIPVSWGQGLIQGFSEAVEAIVRHLGLDVFTTRESNVGGLCEAAKRKADVVLLSDDDRFALIDFKTGKWVDNSEATGRIFAAGLGMMADGLADQKVLLAGCGPVGRHAGWELLRRGADLSLVDPDDQKVHEFVDETESRMKCSVHVASDLDAGLNEHRFVLDATPAADIIDERHVSGDTWVAAPGVPLGLTDRARHAAAERLLHDPLQLGVAAMVAAGLVS